MTEKEFISKYGEESQKVTKNYSTKSLGTNYDIKDAFIEFADNAYDARLNGKELNFNIITNEKEHIFIFQDDGSGVSDDSNLFMLGATDKESNKNKIGKYGIGVPGAVSAIATQCRFNHNESVEIIFESSNCGKCFEKHVIINPIGELIIGKTIYGGCGSEKHGTKITFTNVSLQNPSDVVEAMDETFEIPIHKDFNICFNGRTLGKSGGRHTFVGDEGIKTIMVGNTKVEVKFRILGEVENTTDARSFEESGLRIYDKTSGRLLAKSTDLWKWYGAQKAQQTICGLRTGVFIESTIESYNKFGIKPAKNGVTYKKYGNDKDFFELSEYLKNVYNKGASVNAPSGRKPEITIGSKTFLPTAMKIEGVFKEVSNNSYIFKQKPSVNEIAEMINTIIDLQNKLDRKNSKTKKAEA